MSLECILCKEPTNEIVQGRYCRYCYRKQIIMFEINELLLKNISGTLLNMLNKVIIWDQKEQATKWTFVINESENLCNKLPLTILQEIRYLIKDNQYQYCKGHKILKVGINEPIKIINN